MNKFLGDSVGFIEWESFYCVEGGSIGDGCNVECECDGSGYQAGIHRSSIRKKDWWMREMVMMRERRR